MYNPGPLPRVSVAGLFLCLSPVPPPQCFFCCADCHSAFFLFSSDCLRHASFVLCPAWYAGVTKISQPRANRIGLLYPYASLRMFVTGRLYRPLFLSFFLCIGYYPNFFDTKSCVFKIVRGTRREYSLWTPGRDG